MNVAIICTALLALVMPAFAAQGVERRVTGGVIRGDDLPDGSVIFKSIPFAAPPLNNLRWKPPQPVVPWQGVRDARSAATPCAQLSEGWNANDAAIGSEDCLYLSVHEPKHKSGQHLPVFVWIHGGSNRAGSGGDTIASPIYERGVVLVSIDYRLGVFGFLALHELAAESSHRSSGNYALLDQIEALKWVKANIAAFGGDPNNITVGGQSAGAVDVGQLMRSPLTAGLINKVIQESGVLGPPRSAADNETIGRELLKILEMPAGPTALTQLRKLPTDQLLAASENLKPPSGDHNILWMETSADGWVIPESRNNLYTNDSLFHVPHIVGNVTQEIIFEGSVNATRALIAQVYGPASDAAFKLYGFAATQPAADAILGNVGTQVLTDWMFRCPSYQLASWEIAKHQKVWRYEFGLPRPGRSHVEHTAELDYVFNAIPSGATRQSWPPLQEYWINFIKSGDPNGNSLPHWPDAGAGANYIAFLPAGIQHGRDLHGKVCRLLAERNTSH